MDVQNLGVQTRSKSCVQEEMVARVIVILWWHWHEAGSVPPPTYPMASQRQLGLTAVQVGLPAELSYVLLLDMDERRVNEVPKKLLPEFFYCL